MRLSQLDSFFIRTLYLTAFAIIVLQAFAVDSAVSMLFLLTFFLVVPLWGSGLLRGVTKMDVLVLITIALSLLHVTLNAWLTTTPVSFEYLKKLIMFACTLIYFQAASKLRIDGRNYRFLTGVFTGISLFLAAFYLLDRDASYWMNEQVTRFLTFRFTNPNLASLFLVCLYMVQLVRCFDVRKPLARWFHILLTAVLGYFVLETQSRNSILTMLLVTGLVLVIFLRRRAARIPAWVAALISVLPLLFVLVYVAVIDSPIIQTLFAFMDSEGKELNTRLVVWVPALEDILHSPILGAYSQILQNTEHLQMHNSHLDILASYGFPVLVLVCCLLYRLLRGENPQPTKHETALRLCFCGTLLVGIGEAALFSGGLGIYLFAGIFLLLCDRIPEEAP